MYLNKIKFERKDFRVYGLTLTWDVFKLLKCLNILSYRCWLTLTWDVFKYIWSEFNFINKFD